MKRFRVVAAFLLAPCLLSAAEANPPCGSVLTTDTTLTGDMVCAGTALRIGADGITVDLNGDTISGDGVSVGSAGVENAGYHKVTIENGTITAFFFGIHLEGADDNRIRAITADGNSFSGIYLEEGSDDNRIEESVVINNGSPARPGNGITINGSDGNLVTRTLAANNYTQGIFVGGGADTAASSNTRILNNTSQGNVSNGIGVIGGSGHVIQNNTSVDNGGHGVSFSPLPVPGPVTDSSMVGNTLTGNTLNGIALNDSDGNRIVSNGISGNVLTGILLTEADDNRLTGNRVAGNGVHGILVRSGSDRNAIRGNEFDSNGVSGIVVSVFGGAPADNTFEGNRALGNVSFDVRDQTIGNGTQGTDSTYRGTRCETSVPAGICVP